MGDTDRLADVLAESMHSVSPCFDHEVPDCALCRTRRSRATADAIRTALTDGSLPLRVVLPPEVADVLTAAVACRDDWRGRSIGELLNAVDALPEHLRAALADGGEA